MNLHQWKLQVKNFNAAFQGHKEIFKQWNENSKANLPRFSKKTSVWQLDFKYYRENEKAMILVGSSPRLKKDVKYLKNLDDNFCIICANSSLKFLLKNGIVPDYCICLDSDDIDIPQHLDIDRDDVTLLASSVVSPTVLDKWRGPVYFMPYYSVDKDLKVKIRRRLGRAVKGGGNSISQAFYLSTVVFGSKTVVFVANELCFDKRKDYYADSGAAKQEKLETLTSCIDVLGRQRWTQPALYNYATWIEKICCDLSPPGFFIDTSFGLVGKDCPVLHLMSLKEAIEKVKEAFKLKTRLNKAETDEQRLKIINEVAVKQDAKKSDVYRYNMHEQRERIMQLART